MSDLECFKCDETFDSVSEQKEHRREEHPDYDDAMNALGSAMAEETM